MIYQYYMEIVREWFSARNLDCLITVYDGNPDHDGKSDQPKEPQICFFRRNKCERGTQVLVHNKCHILEIFGGCF